MSSWVLKIWNWIKYWISSCLHEFWIWIWNFIEGSLEVKLPTIWTDEKQRRGRGREKRRVEERRWWKRKSQKKGDADARKGRKVAKNCVFPMICGSGGSKSRLAKAAGAEPSVMRDEKVHAVVARSTFPSQKVKNTPVPDYFWKLRFGKVHAVVAQSTFPSQNVQSTPVSDYFWKLRFGKVHAVVARTTFPSQNVQNTPFLDHFWKLRCRKSARRCSAKHISKSKCTNHRMFAPLLEVQMSFRVAGARDCAPCQKWAKREGFVAFPKTMAGVGHLKRICKDALSVAGAVQKTCSWEMLGGQGADFLRGVAFWSIRSGLLRWFCMTGAALRMTSHHFFVAGAVL